MEVSLLGCADRDEQMSNGWSYPLLNDEQMSNKVRVEHQPAFGGMPKSPDLYLTFHIIQCFRVIMATTKIF